MINYGSTDSVAGRFGYLWTDQDDLPVVMASGWFADPEYLVALMHPALRPQTVSTAASTIIDDAVRDYSDGDLTAIDAISVRQRSGPFLEAAWEALRKTRPGQPTTYTILADAAGRPEAVRAAAAACARNAVALFVPCHRIIRRDGTLGGFRYGLEVKRTLRAHESPAAGEETTPRRHAAYSGA